VRALLAALVLALLGMLGARWGFRADRAPVSIRLVLSTGTHVLLVGFLLGPNGADLLGPGLLDAFSPAIVLGLGWIGLMFGMQFDSSVMATLRPAEVAGATAQAVVAFALLAAVGLGLVRGIPGAGKEATLLVLCTAAIAAISTPTGLAIVFGSAPVRGGLSRILSVAGSLDGAVGLGALAVVLAVLHPHTSPGGFAPPVVRWLLTSVLLGVLAGWLLVSLLRVRPRRPEMVLFLIGLGLLAAGTQAFFHLSALFGSAVAGVFVARASPASRRLQDALVRWEKPVHVVFLLLSGALLRWPGWEVVPLVLAYVVLRAGAKLAGGLAVLPALPSSQRTPALGLGLLAQGGLSIAMAVSIRHILGGSGGHALDLFFATVVLGVTVSEAVGPPIIRQLLVRRGELVTGTDGV
jgi:Kef-type K+ transport system membrane component KefB